MRATLFATSAWFSSLGLASNLLAASPATLDPTITPAPDISLELLRRQNNVRFIGWVSFSGEWLSRTCDLGGTYYQSGDYWRCCATTLDGCNVPVGCAAGSLIYSITTSGTSKLTSVDWYVDAACNLGWRIELTRIVYSTSIYTDDSSFTICNTGLVFENSADSDAQTNVFCGISSLNWSYYRASPPTSTPTLPSTSRKPSAPQL
jgi:hypothetical protein